MTSILRQQSQTFLWTKLLTIAVLAFIAIGCGSNNDDFVFSGNQNTPTGTTGSATFNFIRAQNPLTVPSSTSDIRFEFFTGVQGSGNSTLVTTQAFATQITIENIPIATKSVVITPLGPEGEPLAEGTANLALTAGSNTVVDLSNVTLAPVSLSNLVLSPANATIGVAGTQQFTANASFSNGDSLPLSAAWTVSNGSASVNAATGLVTGVSPGEVTVTATRDGVSGNAALTVSGTSIGDLVSIETTPPVSEIVEGGSTQLTTNGTFQDMTSRPLNNQGDGLTYLSNNTEVATVDSNGLVNAVNSGAAIITAKAGSFEDTVTVVVNPNEGPILSVDQTELYYQDGSAALPLFPNALVFHDLSNLNGGNLRIEVSEGSSSNVVITLPLNPSIGNIVNNGSSSVLLAFNTGATPAAIQQVLRNVTLATSGLDTQAGPRLLRATVEDQFGNFFFDSRDVIIASSEAVQFTVDPNGPNAEPDFIDLQDAIDAVEANGAPFSVINVVAADLTSGGDNGDGRYFVDFAPNLVGLRLQGANAGISAGVEPGARGDETIISLLAVDEFNVVLDGFHILNGVAENFNGGVVLGDDANKFQSLNNFFERDTDLGTRRAITNFSVDSVPNDVVVRDSRFEGWLVGVRLVGSFDRPVDFLTIVGNAFIDNDFGVRLRRVVGDDVIIEDNGFSGNFEAHVLVRQALFTVELLGNSFLNEGVVFAGNAEVRALDNWWGQISGPLASQVETAGIGVVFTNPFLSEDPFPDFP